MLRGYADVFRVTVRWVASGLLGNWVRSIFANRLNIRGNSVCLTSDTFLFVINRVGRRVLLASLVESTVIPLM